MEEKTPRMPLLEWCLFMFFGTVVLTIVYSFAQTPLYFEGLLIWWKLILLCLGLGAILEMYLYFEKLYRKCNPQPVDRILSSNGLIKHTATGLAIGFEYFCLVVSVMMLIGVYSIKTCQFDAKQLLLWFVAYLLVAVSEECIFRGVLFRLIDERWGFWTAIILSSLIFGLVHWANDNGTFFAGLAIAVEAGLLLGAAYKYSGSLWLPIGIHWAWNFSQGNIFGFAVSGNGEEASIISPQITGPEILTGGPFGAEASVIAMVLGFLFSCWFIYKYQQRERCNCETREENVPLSNELKNNDLEE